MPDLKARLASLFDIFALLFDLGVDGAIESFCTFHVFAVD